MITIKKYLVGLVLTLGLSIIAIYCSNIAYIKNFGLSSIVLAILMGLIIGNTFYPYLSRYCRVGVDLSKSKILRLAIILFGIKLTFQDIAFVGYKGITIDILMITLTFFITIWLGMRIFKMDKDSMILIGSGCSICGAAAVIATESTINSAPEKVTIAVAVVVVFGTLGMFIYPVIYSYIATIWPITDTAFGIYIGSTVHEVAQVVAAGNAISEPAAETAVISKMIRVLMLAPFLMILSAFLIKKQRHSHPQIKQKIVIPWFAVGFLLMACINSLGILPARLVSIIIIIDNILLAMAMSALGLTSHYSAFQKAGIKPLLLGFVIFIWLIIGGGAVNYMIQSIY